jgi:hypothetical protein
MSMTDEALTRWVKAWAAKYAVSQDDVLRPLHGARALDRAAVFALVEWKFNAMPHRRANAKRGIAKERDQVVVDVTSAAHSCIDDGAALRLLTVLQGVGPALGSALLMAMDPTRWTVLDVRALTSVRAVGYESIPDNAQDRRTWLPYLEACRDVQARTHEPLRSVDRALFAANGKTGLPTH